MVVKYCQINEQWQINVIYAYNTRQSQIPVYFSHTNKIEINLILLMVKWVKLFLVAVLCLDQRFFKQGSTDKFWRLLDKLSICLINALPVVVLSLFAQTSSKLVFMFSKFTLYLLFRRTIYHKLKKITLYF